MYFKMCISHKQFDQYEVMHNQLAFLLNQYFEKKERLYVT